MLILLPVLIALVSAAGAFVLAIRARNSAASLVRRIVVPENSAAATGRVVRGVQFRMLASLVVGVVVAAVVAELPIAGVQTALAIAPGVGAAAALLVLVVSPFPRRTPENGLRQAELTPRTPGTFGPRWGFVLPSVAAALLVALLIATGLSASPIDGTFSREFMVVIRPGQANSAGPYPGWAYGLPILGATAALIAAVLFALNRIAAAPRIGHPDAVTLDRSLRAALTRFTMLSGTAVIVLYLGAVSLTAGEAARSASQWSYIKPSFEAAVCGHKTSCTFVATPADTVSGVVQPSYTIGAVGTALGIILIGVAIAVALFAITNVVIRWSVSDPVEPEKVDA